MTLNREPVPPLPPQGKVEWNLLRLLSGRSQPTDAQSAYRELALLMEVTPLQLSAIDAASGRSSWEWEVRRAKQRLLDAGLLWCPQKDAWLLTEKGYRCATQTAEDLGL
jgi:hypothetical protein